MIEHKILYGTFIELFLVGAHQYFHTLQTGTVRPYNVTVGINPGLESPVSAFNLPNHNDIQSANTSNMHSFLFPNAPVLFCIPVG